MARYKNALTKYEVAEIPTSSTTQPTWYELAKYILSVSPNDNESTEEEGFYDGDGTPETAVMAIAMGYSFSGYDDPDDDAQALIRSLKLEVGEGRHIMFRVTESGTGANTYTGEATVSNIVSGSGGGDATNFADFSCDISFNGKPTVAAVVA